MTSPDLKQLTDLAREMRRVLSRYRNAYPAFRIKPIGAPNSLARIEQENLMRLEESASAAIARADALIGPGDGFQEVERLNEGAEHDAS